MFSKTWTVIWLTIQVTKAETQPNVTDLLPNTTECGISSTFNEFPWMVLITYHHNPRSFDCAGVLINSRYILTAAGCTHAGTSPILPIKSVRLGEYNLNRDPDCITTASGRQCAPPYLEMEVEEEDVKHEDYNYYKFNFHHNIGLLRLKEEVNFTETVRPICLPITPEERSRTYAVGRRLTVASWGQTESDGPLAAVRRKVKPPLIDHDVCATWHAGGFELEKGDGQFCAGSRNGSICFGDHGNALMAAHVIENTEVRWYAVGLVNHGPCGENDAPSVYTNVSTYMPWIISKLRP